MRVFFSAVLFCLSCFFSTARAATLSGFITDQNDGEILPYTTVALIGTQLGSMSNTSGYYAIKGLVAGTYVVQFSHIGYQSRVDTLELAGEDLRLDVGLVLASIQMEEEVVVTAERDEIERRAQTGFLALQSQTLEKLPAVGEPDLLRSLQLLPGIQAASDISSGLYVRGGGPDQTRILLDQIPLYNPSHAFGFFSTFNPDAIRDVNLYKGAYPATYGGALGAVLDVANREGNRQKTAISGGVSLISGRLLAEGPVGQGAWMLSGRRTYLDPLLSAIRNQGVDVPSYYFYDFNGKVNQKIGSSDSFVASTYWGQDELNFDLDANAETFINLRWGNRALTGKWTHVFSPALIGSFMGAFSKYKSVTSVSIFETPFRIENSIRDVSLKGDVDYFASSAHSLSGGFLLTSYRFVYNQSFNQDVSLDLRQTPYQLDFYLQDDWKPFVTTQIRLGTRASFFSEGERWNIMPRFSVSHALKSDVRLKVGGGMYSQYLQLISTEGFNGGDFWVPLDETVKPGRSLQGVVGLEWEHSRRYQLTVESYYTDLANLVLLDNDTVVDSENTRSDDVFKSGGSGYSTGLEVFLQRRTGRLTGWVGYTLGWTRRTFAEVDQGREFAPKFDRRHDVSFVLSYRRGKWTWGTNFIYATGQAYTPASARFTLRSPGTGVVEDYALPARRNSARLLPYHRMDVSVRRDVKLWGLDAEVYLQIFNLYSRRNEWFVQYGDNETSTSAGETLFEPEVIKMLPIIPTMGFNFKF